MPLRPRRCLRPRKPARTGYRCMEIPGQCVGGGRKRIKNEVGIVDHVAGHLADLGAEGGEFAHDSP